MAAITTTQAADIIPKFWLNEALQRYRNAIVLAGLVRRDFSNETGNLGDTINVPTMADVSVVDKAEGTAITPQAPSSGKIPIVLNKHKVASWAVEDHAAAKAVPMGLQYLDRAMPLIAEAVESDLMALYADASTTVGSAGTDLTPATILAARKALNDVRVPTSNRIAIVSPSDDVALLGDDLFVAADKRGDMGTALREATLGRVYGFDFYMSQLIPETGAGPTRHNMFLHPDAMVLASRPLPLPEPDQGVRSAIVTDPISGLSFRYTSGYSITDQATIHTIDVLYGVKTMRADAIVEAVA